MSRMNSFDVAGRVDNTSMLVGTEVNKKVATVKNYKIDAVRRFILEGLSPETGGLLKYHEIAYEGNQYSTPAEFVNSLNPDIDILRYHVLVVTINEDKYLFTRQGVTIGSDSDVVEDEDFIALSGITAATIRDLIADLEERTNIAIDGLAELIDTKLSDLEIVIDDSSSDLLSIINAETANRQASVSILNSAIANENEARAELAISLNAKIDNETSSRSAAINSVYTALANETEARAELKTELEASIENETTQRNAAITSVQTALVNESEARAELSTQLNAAITTEASTRNAAITSLNTAIVNETSARASAITNLTAAIGTETSNRQAAINTLNTVIADESSARATAINSLGTTVTNNFNTLSSNITNESQARTTALNSVASSINTLTSSVNGNTASITTTQETLATLDGKFNASYQLSVGANGKVAGMKLGSDGITSQIAFTADSFKIFNGTSNVSPFIVENGQVKMTGVTTADTLITPGNGPAFPAAGWNGLSINNGNDNALRFRHANGRVGIEIGIIGGQLTLNWYNDQGVLIWQGGSNGITYIDNIPESWTTIELGAISLTTPEILDETQKEFLRNEADSRIAFYTIGPNGEMSIGAGNEGAFPMNRVARYLYWAGQNAQASANKIYEGVHIDASVSSPFIPDGWYGQWTTGFPPGDVYINLYYYKNGKVSSNYSFNLYKPGFN